MKPALITAITLSLGIGAATGTAQTPLKLLTEESPFTKQVAPDFSGGEASRFVTRMLRQAGIDYSLQFLPWRRAYRYVLAEPDVMIYPLARSKEREDQFVWIGQLIPVNYYLFKLRSRKDIQITRLEDAKKYSTGVVNYHVHHEYLESEGFTELQPVNSNLQNIRKALLGRIDLFPISDGGLMPICQGNDIDCSRFEPVFKLDDLSGGLYIAVSLNTDPDTVRRATQAYNSLLRDNTHSAIFHDRFQEIRKFDLSWPEFSSQ